MDDRQRLAITFVASQLVFVAALIHLALGAIEWYRYASLGFFVPPDIRYPMFVLSGVAILAGMTVAWQSERRKPWYLLGFLAMLGYVFGYFFWHLSGHRPLFLFGPATSHPLTFQFLIDHYLAGSFETISLTVDLLAAALLGVLYVLDQE